MLAIDAARPVMCSIALPSLQGTGRACDTDPSPDHPAASLYHHHNNCRVHQLEQTMDDENQAANEREETWMELQSDWEAMEQDMQTEIQRWVLTHQGQLTSGCVQVRRLLGENVRTIGGTEWSMQR
jgi:hypothetical protein